MDAVPCLASGLVVALAISRYRRAIGAVYAFDLAGAGLGALAVVPALWRVDVIELIDANRRVVDEDLASLSGSPYSRPGVFTTIGDGRSVLASRKTLYDQIYLGFTDTLSANPHRSPERAMIAQEFDFTGVFLRERILPVFVTEEKAL